MGKRVGRCAGFCVDEWVSEWPGERVVEGGGRWVGALFGCALVADPGGAPPPPPPIPRGRYHSGQFGPLVPQGETQLYMSASAG